MKYHCGHDGCDICGIRSCANAVLRKVGQYLVCMVCERVAVDFAVEAAGRFGGVTIDLAEPCVASKL